MDKHSANTEDSARQVLVAQWTTLGQYRRQRTASVSSAMDKHSANTEDSARQVLVAQWTNNRPIQKTAHGNC